MCKLFYVADYKIYMVCIHCDAQNKRRIKQILMKNHLEIAIWVLYHKFYTLIEVTFLDRMKKFHPTSDSDSNL